MHNNTATIKATRQAKNIQPYLDSVCKKSCVTNQILDTVGDRPPRLSPAKPLVLLNSKLNAFVASTNAVRLGKVPAANHVAYCYAVAVHTCAIDLPF